jgi:hypothetical protein
MAGCEVPVPFFNTTHDLEMIEVGCGKRITYPSRPPGKNRAFVVPILAGSASLAG